MKNQLGETWAGNRFIAIADLHRTRRRLKFGSRGLAPNNGHRGGSITAVHAKLRYGRGVQVCYRARLTGPGP